MPTPRCQCPCGTCSKPGITGREGFEEDILCEYCHTLESLFSAPSVIEPQSMLLAASIPARLALSESRKMSMNHIDSYLEHQMKGERKLFHFLMQVSNSFDPTKIPGLTISGKLGDVWSASGSKESIEALRSAEGIISVEASR